MPIPLAYPNRLYLQGVVGGYEPGYITSCTLLSLPAVSLPLSIDSLFQSPLISGLLHYYHQFIMEDTNKKVVILSSTNYEKWFALTKAKLQAKGGTYILNVTRAQYLLLHPRRYARDPEGLGHTCLFNWGLLWQGAREVA